MASKDFNYQVALKEGLKSLEQGRLRQAEQSFKYLVDKFPGAEGGYRGLAKVHFEQEDRAAALKVLREGAAALTKSGERSGAIGLLRQAVVLDPRDLATHRRLAAGLALAGDTDASVQEYARFIRSLRDSGDSERAKNEGQAYSNDIVPRARGLASRLLQEADGYNTQVIQEAEGNASRFKQILVEYNKAPVVTRERLYLDMMQSVLGNSSKVLIDQKSGANLLNLPLDKLFQQGAAGAAATANDAASTPPRAATTP